MKKPWLREGKWLAHSHTARKWLWILSDFKALASSTCHSASKICAAQTSSENTPLPIVVFTKQLIDAHAKSFHILHHVILLSTLGSRYRCHPQLTEEETEAQRSEATCWRSCCYKESLLAFQPLFTWVSRTGSEPPYLPPSLFFLASHASSKHLVETKKVDFYIPISSGFLLIF